MHQHVIEHAAQRIFGVGVLSRDFHRLRDRDAEAARRIRMRLEDRLAGVGLVARACDAFRAVGLHQRSPVGLLIVGDPDHVDFDFEAEQRAGEGERRAPLPRAGLGRELGHALFLVVKSLRHGGVGLVTAGRADALVFVEDAGGRSERLLEPPGAIERRWTPHAVDVAHRRRDLDMPLGAHLLPDQRHRKERREIVRADRLSGPWVQHRRRRRRQIGDDIVPGVRYPVLAHQIFRLLAHASLQVFASDPASPPVNSNPCAMMDNRTGSCKPAGRQLPSRRCVFQAPLAGRRISSRSGWGGWRRSARRRS